MKLTPSPNLLKKNFSLKQPLRIKGRMKNDFHYLQVERLKNVTILVGITVRIIINIVEVIKNRTHVLWTMNFTIFVIIFTVILKPSQFLQNSIMETFLKIFQVWNWKVHIKLFFYSLIVHMYTYNSRSLSVKFS